MPYLPNIPQPTDQLSVSQANILNNFQALGAIGGKVGVPASASLNNTAGFNFVYLPNQPGAPTIPLNQVALYSFLNPGSNEFELYINHTVFSSVNPIQTPATASVLGNSTPGLNSKGWTYLPSGILLKWGRVGVPGTVNLNDGTYGPNYTQILSATFSPVNNNTTIYGNVNGVANLTLNFFGTGPAIAYFFTIGIGS